ncbi:MAG: FMN-binding protein [Bacteroidota bacterium]
MNTKIKLCSFGLLIAAITLFVGCKEKKVEKPAPKTVEAQVKAVPKTLKQVGDFASLSFASIDEASNQLGFLLVDSQGVVQNSEMNTALRQYRNLTSSKVVDSWPVFELKNSNEAIITVQGEGYIGRIWATILVGRASGKIKKITLGHLAESETHGAKMTRSSFQDQFIGKLVNSQDQTFGHRQDGMIITDGPQLVDGISGATVTSRAVVNMLNSGIERYHEYLANAE